MLEACLSNIHQPMLVFAKLATSSRPTIHASLCLCVHPIIADVLCAVRDQSTVVLLAMLRDSSRQMPTTQPCVLAYLAYFMMEFLASLATLLSLNLVHPVPPKPYA